ncbi:MAG: Rne/Rng family ribonuclease [Clostridia bacterium]
MKQLLIDYNPFCVRVALCENGELIDFSVERAYMRGLVGNIYKGKVENVISGMKAAFVNIGLEKNGFLYVGDSLVDSCGLADARQFAPLNVSAGDTIMCQVVKDEFGTKGARLTTDVTLPGYFLVLLPRSTFIGVSRKIEDPERREYLEGYVKTLCPPNMGFIIRSAAYKASNVDIKTEADKLVELWEKIQQDYYKTEVKSLVFKDAELLERAIRDTFSEDVDSVIVNEPLVAKQLEGKVGNATIEIYSGAKNILAQFGINAKINSLADRRVELDSGAYLVIDKTEALTVIDVNTGRYVGGKDLEDTVFKTNILAAEGIARQLRLRNISGIVIIDFIDMLVQEHREALVEKLRNELKHDRLKTSVVSMTNLGLVELTRKKTRLPVDNFMLQPCDSCKGGFVTSCEQLVFMLRDEVIDFTIKNNCKKIAVRLAPEICKTALEKNIVCREINTIWKDKQIYMIADTSVQRDKFVITEITGDAIPDGGVLLKC